VNREPAVRRAATRLKSELAEDIADTLNVETPPIDPGDAVPVEFL
jgi:hypothetical protein